MTSISNTTTEVPITRNEATIAASIKSDDVELVNDASSVATKRQRLKALNWEGCIPVEITLAQSSLSSPSMPPPLYRMVPRQSYLHISLFDAIERLSMFAVTSPALRSPQNDIINNTWLEDKYTKKPIRWHLFAGVSFDLLSSLPMSGRSIQHQLPWKVTLHFSSYPHDKILSLSNGLETIRQYYFNSLKQSLYMQYGNAKKSTSEITKHHHDILWESLRTNNYGMFSSVNQHLQRTIENCDGGKTIILPVRVLVDSLPIIQRPYRITGDRTTALRNNPHTNTSGTLHAISDNSIHRSSGTLGDLLLDWLPHLFHEVIKSTRSKHDKDMSSPEQISDVARSIQPRYPWIPPLHNHTELQPGPTPYRTTWLIQGITPSLQSSVLDLWYSLCHPDLFLYIIVRTTLQDDS